MASDIFCTHSMAASAITGALTSMESRITRADRINDFCTARVERGGNSLLRIKTGDPGLGNQPLHGIRILGVIDQVGIQLLLHHG